MELDDFHGSSRWRLYTFTKLTLPFNFVGHLKGRLAVRVNRKAASRFARNSLMYRIHHRWLSWPRATFGTPSLSLEK